MLCRLRRLPLLAVVLLVTACGGTATVAPGQSAAPATPEATGTAAPPAATATPEATPAAAQGVLAAPTAGFSMPLPEGWVLLPLDDPQAALALLSADSQLRGVVEGGLDAYVEAGMAGWAVDGTAGAGIVTPNANLIVREGIDIPTLDDLRTAVTEDLATVEGINAIEAEVVDLPDGPAVRATYLGLGEGSDAQARGIQYAIPAGERLLILSFTVPTNDAAREAAVDAMVAGMSISQ